MNPGVIVGGVVLALFAVGALSMTACSDPGILPKQTVAQVRACEPALSCFPCTGPVLVLVQLDEARRACAEAGTLDQFTVCRKMYTIPERTTLLVKHARPRRILQRIEASPYHSLL